MPNMGNGPYTNFTFDASTRDAAGAFLIGELERLDPKMHGPLYAYTWGRDVDLREDITVGDEVSSFLNSSFAAAGGVTPNGISWIGKDVNAITGAQLDIGKTPQPLYIWGMELAYTTLELLSAQRVGRPIDDQKLEVIRVKYQMDIDQCVYTGDTTIGSKGLLNHPLVTNVANATTGNWSNPATTPDQMAADVNNFIQSVWQTSGYAICPDQLRLPPAKFSILVNTKMSTAGNISVMRYIQENTICNTQNGRPINIQPVKWLPGIGAAGTDRMIAYTKDYDRVRFPLTPLSRTAPEFRSLYTMTTYYGRVGLIEIPYPETIGYRDGI
jgi:hypothetical protein